MPEPLKLRISGLNNGVKGMTMLTSSRTTVSSSNSHDDPFDAILRPPQDESPQERETRIAREEEAKRVSQAIDDSIKAERQLRKKRRIVRLLLLGQSESGEFFFNAVHVYHSIFIRREINDITT